VVAELELPVDERETVDGCLRQIDFLNAEIAILERASPSTRCTLTTGTRGLVARGPPPA
jgi:hypothetical protein